MNILFATTVGVSEGTGDSVVSKEVVAALSKKSSVNLFLVCPESVNGIPSEINISSENIRYLPPKVPKSIRWSIMSQLHMLCAMNKLIGEKKPDVIVARLSTQLIAPPLWAKLHRIPYILLVSGTGIRKEEFTLSVYHFLKFTKPVRWLNARVAREIYAAYQEAKQEMDGFRSPSQKETKIFSNAVNPNLFSPVPIHEARKKLGLPFRSDDFVIGFVGSFRPIHCLIPLINAMEKFKEKKENKFKLLLVGTGLQFEELRQIVKQDNIEKSVMFTGWVPHDKVPLYMSACDILYGVIDPGHWGDPIKCYESLACERPIIIDKLRCSRTFKFVQKENCGVIVDSVEASQIVRAIEELYLISEEERRAMGKRGRKYIIKHHTWDKLADAIVEAWESERK